MRRRGVSLRAEGDGLAATWRIRLLLGFALLWGASPIVLPGAAASDVLIYGSPAPDNEVSLAVNPLNADNLVAGFNDFEGGQWMASYAWSMDAGDTWTYGGSLPRGALAGRPWCDPWLAFDREGYLYYVALSDTEKGEIFVCVAAPDTAGIVGPSGFDDPQIVDPGDRYNDKPAIAVDRSGGGHDGNVYVVWKHRPPSITSGTSIFFRRGRRTPGLTTLTWDPPRQLTPVGVTRGPQVAVGPGGEVYVAYYRGHTVGHTSHVQAFYASADGGTTFSGPIEVAAVTEVEPYATPTTGRPGIDLEGWARKSSSPTLGVSPTGTIFIAWTDGRFGDDDILLARSGDGGATWLDPPKRVNTDPLGNGKDQWSPALAVNGRGTLDVIFYDRRSDPRNESTMLYRARSRDGGDSFTNLPVSDTATDPTPFCCWAPSSLGDYVGIAAMGDWTYMGWADGRNARPTPFPDFNSDLYFDKCHEVEPAFERHPIVTLAKGIRTVLTRPPLLPIVWHLSVGAVEGFDGPVGLESLGTPPGIAYRFEPEGGVPPFETTFTMEMEAGQPGTYEVKILAEYGEDIFVLPLDLTLTEEPFVLLGAAVANPGDALGVEARGFAENAPFEISLDGRVVAGGGVEPGGIVSETIALPPDTEPGIHQIAVKDERGNEAGALLATPRADPEAREEGRPVPFVRGDPNADGNRDIADAICILDYLFGGAEAPCKTRVPRCRGTADLNDDGAIDIADPIVLLRYLFSGGAKPPEPFDACGLDPTMAAVGCATFEPCR